MSYVRKTRDEIDIQQRTESGWETVHTEEKWREARVRAREYRENQPEYPVRCKATRVRIEREAARAAGKAK